MTGPAKDAAELLIEQGLDRMIREIVGGKRGAAKQRVRVGLARLRPLLMLLARAIRLRLAVLDAPSRLDIEVAGAAVGRALQSRMDAHGLAGVGSGSPRLLVGWGTQIALMVAAVLAEQRAGPRRTPRTRLTWATLGEWLRARDRLDRRPPSSAKNRAWDEHHAALTQAIVNTGTAAELAELKAIAARAHDGVVQDWIYLAEQDLSGRVRKLAQALRRAAAQRLPRKVGCADLVADGYPSAAAAARLGERRLDDLRRLLAPELQVTFDARSCTYELVRARRERA